MYCLSWRNPPLGYGQVDLTNQNLTLAFAFHIDNHYTAENKLSIYLKVTNETSNNMLFKIKTWKTTKRRKQNTHQHSFLRHSH